MHAWLNRQDFFAFASYSASQTNCPFARIPTAVTMSAEEKKGEDKGQQINLKVKDQVRGRPESRRLRSSTSSSVFKFPSASPDASLSIRRTTPRSTSR